MQKVLQTNKSRKAMELLQDLDMPIIRVAKLTTYLIDTNPDALKLLQFLATKQEVEPKEIKKVLQTPTRDISGQQIKQMVTKINREVGANAIINNRKSHRKSTYKLSYWWLSYMLIEDRDKWTKYFKENQFTNKELENYYSLNFTEQLNKITKKEKLFDWFLSLSNNTDRHKSNILPMK